MKSVCALPNCPNLVEGGGPHSYCQDHLGDGAILDMLENLCGYVDQAVGQLDRIARRLEADNG